MNETPRRSVEVAADHAVVQASRRAAIARARFNRELEALINDIHAAREREHGHSLPHEHDGHADQPEDER